VGDFLRDNAAARANFFRYALHLWPRLLRGVREMIGADETGGEK
jgi:hypothetical protein